MPGPPFLENFGTSDGEVLPVGKWTCPYCLPSGSGGDPSDWSVSATHAQLLTLQEPNVVTFTISGTHETDWERTEITESGDQASCAKRIEKHTGVTGVVEYEFVSTPGSAAKTCLGLADGTGSLGETTGSTPEDQQADVTVVTDNQTGSALCGSTGCVAGDYGAYNDDDAGEITADTLGASYSEKFCRDTIGTYRYTFTGEVTVTGIAGPSGPAMSVRALLYTGTFDEDRWGITLPIDPEFTLSGETTVGTVRGASIKCKYISFSVDHADSTIVGTAGQCPLPSFSSDVTVGTTTGTITVTVSG
jgi:hypothetical protein